MSKQLNFGLALIVAGIIMFLVTFNFFYIIIFIIKVIFYLSSAIIALGGIHEIIEYNKTRKK